MHPSLALICCSILGIGGSPGGLVPSLAVIAPPELTCPGSKAVEQTLGTNPPAEEGIAWTLLMNHAKAGVRIDLRDPHGAIVLSRTLGVNPRRCEIAAQAIGIIVERYFRALGPSPEGIVDANVPTMVVARQDHGPGPLSSDLPRMARMVVGVGPAYWTRPRTPSLALDIRVRLGSFLLVGFGTLLPPFDVKGNLPSLSGQAQLSGFPVLVQLATAGVRGRFAGRLGFQSLVTLERGESQSIASPAIAWRALLAAGVSLGGDVRLGSRLRIAADMAILHSVLGRSYQVDGVAGPVLDPPPWQAIIAIHLDWMIFL